ncbi:hypothetical protein YQE_03919, partial [Dendroctonus ponderosae]
MQRPKRSLIFTNHEQTDRNLSISPVHMEATLRHQNLQAQIFRFRIGLQQTPQMYHRSRADFPGSQGDLETKELTQVAILGKVKAAAIQMRLSQVIREHNGPKVQPQGLLQVKMVDRKHLKVHLERVQVQQAWTRVQALHSRISALLEKWCVKDSQTLELVPGLENKIFVRDTTGEHGIAGPSEVNEGDYSAIPGEPDADYPIFSFVPQTSFSCDQQRYPGYYADVEARCQVFHVCANNKTYDFLCPNGTIFHQQFFVCVWWNQFDCNTAQSLYEMNANIYDHAISGAQQQTGGIPAGSGADGYGGGFVGTQPPNINQQVSEGSQIPSAPVGADGFQTPGYQPTGPGALPSVSSQQTQTNSYPSQEPLASGGNGGYPSGGPSRPQGMGSNTFFKNFQELAQCSRNGVVRQPNAVTLRRSPVTSADGL